MKTSSFTCALLVAGLRGFAPDLAPEVAHAPAKDHQTHPGPLSRRPDEDYGVLPLFFEANRGQTDNRVEFLLRANDFTLFLTRGNALFIGQPASSRVRYGSSPASSRAQSNMIRMNLVGARDNPRAQPVETLSGRVNYLLGADPSAWRLNVPTYAQVRYHHVYPGIDLLYSASTRLLEYDFIVSPGADPGQIRLQFEGAQLRLDAHGDLLLASKSGLLRHRAPHAYLKSDPARTPVPCTFVLDGKRGVGFRLGPYPHRETLIIDPQLVYSTYLGGSGSDFAASVAVTPTGEAVVAGTTGSPDFPLQNPFQSMRVGTVYNDLFVTKLNSEGNGIVYSTYIGGLGEDNSIGVAVDANGHAYVTGITFSSDFPLSRPFQSSIGVDEFDAFVLKLDPSGSQLLYSTFLGGDSFDQSMGIAVDDEAKVYVAGWTDSPNFPTVNPFKAIPQQREAFVAKIDPAQSGPDSLVYSTYLGGSAFDVASGIAVDSLGNAYVVGLTGSTDFPTVGAFQPAPLGLGDGFLAKLNPSGSGLLYATYLGGSGSDRAKAIAVDADGGAYVAGALFSTDFPTSHAFQPNFTPGGPFAIDGFLIKIDTLQSGLESLAYSTYLGGTGEDEPAAVAVHLGNAYLTGRTTSSDLLVVDAIQPTYAGGSVEFAGDAFVMRVDTSLDGLPSLVYSTYLGGNIGPTGDEAAAGIAVDAVGNAYVVGGTTSLNFPTSRPLQPSSAEGFSDAFITKIGILANSPPVAVAGSDMIVECILGGQTLTLDGTRSTDDDSSVETNDDIVLFQWFEGFGSSSEILLGTGELIEVTLALGPHEITLKVTDRSGATGTDDVLVGVVDSTPPSVSAAADPAELWPPNHRMVPVTVAVAAQDLCDPAPLVELTSVTSSEPDDAADEGDGHTANDIQGTLFGELDFEITLRAERSASGPGRLYSIIYSGTDSSGNVATSQVGVIVPQRQGGTDEPVQVEISRSADAGATSTWLHWTSIPEARHYDVLRGRISGLSRVGSFTVVKDAACAARSVTTTAFSNTDVDEEPPVGEGFFYLVEYLAGGYSGYGSTAGGGEVLINSGDSCH